MDNQMAACQVVFSLGGTEYNRKVFISTTGAIMVFDLANAPPGFDKFLNKKMNIMVDHIEMTGAFVKETQNKFSFYSFRFRENKEAVKQQLLDLIDRKGAKLPPRRKFPRLSAQVEDPNIAVPSYAIYNDEDNTLFFSVVDFTIGGLLFETLREDSPTIQVGDTIEFELFVTAGVQHIPDARGEVVRVTETLPEVETGDIYVRYGIKLHKLSKHSEETYNKIIKDYCLAIKEQDKEAGEG